jgi:hypothetical protein
MAQVMIRTPEHGNTKRAQGWLSPATQGGRQTLMVLGALALALSSGCTALLELDRDQCAVNGDCADLFGPTAPYVCMNKVCERPACDTDQSCRSLGENFATSVCIDSFCREAECSAEVPCGLGATCNLTTNRCAPRECDTTQDCLLRKPSPTVQCQQGFCVDPTWSCIGQPDPRVPVPGETGTLRIPLLSSADGKPVPGTSWKIRVCLPAQFDLPCATPLAAETSYDSATGIATISGLSYDQPIRILFDEQSMKEPGPTGELQPAILAMDFHTQKPVVGTMDAPALRVVTRAGLTALVTSFYSVLAEGQVAVDPTKGNIYGVVFDCEDKPAANVQMTYSNALGAPLSPAPVVLHFNEQNVPSLKRQWSYATGVFSTLNLPKNENMNVATSLSFDTSLDPNVVPPANKLRSIRSDYSMLLPEGRMTTVHLYPRNYTR